MKKLKVLHLAPNPYDSPFHRGAMEREFRKVFDITKINIDELKQKPGKWGDSIFQEVEKFRSDIILITNNLINIEVLRRIKLKFPDTFIAVFISDTQEQVWEKAIEFGRVGDCLLVNQFDEQQLEVYRNGGVGNIKTWYQGADPDVYFPLYDDLGRCFFDLCFIGKDKTGLNHKWYQEYSTYYRKKIILELNKRSDIRFLVVGREWDGAVLKNYMNNAFQELANQVISNSIMTLGIQGSPHIRGGFSIRFFNHLCAGRLHVALYCKGLEQYFENGKHLVWFKTIAELIEIVHYYKNHLDQAHEIGIAGRQLVCEKHTYLNRAKELLGFYKEWEHTNKKKDIL